MAQNYEHQRDCNLVQRQKRRLLKEMGIIGNPNDCYLVYLHIGDDIKELIVGSGLTSSQQIAPSLVGDRDSSIFCSHCVEKVILEEKELYDGVHISVINTIGPDGKDSDELYLEHETKKTIKKGN